MGALSPWHLIIIAILLLVVFGGRGKISGVMGDAAKGIRAFRDGLKEEPATTTTQPATVQPISTTTTTQPAAPVAPPPRTEAEKDEAPR